MKQRNDSKKQVMLTGNRIARITLGALLLLAPVGLNAEAPLGNSQQEVTAAGMPRFVLFTTKEASGYLVKAECMDAAMAKNTYPNSSVRFTWGVRYPGKEIVWTAGDKASLLVPSGEDGTVVILKVTDQDGKNETVQSIKVSEKEVYYAINNQILIDSKKNIYLEDGEEYSYEYGEVDLDFNPDSPSKYAGYAWTATSATVYTPHATHYDVDISRGHISIMDIIPEEEVNYIVKNGEVGHEVVYTIALKNPNNGIIQLIPFSVKFK